MDEICSLTKSMNLTLKPTKCCSMSICSGKPTEILFNLGGNELQNVKTKPEKFLGSMITFCMKSADAFVFVARKLDNVIENIDASLVRKEYKVATYSRYALPSLRYMLTVHDLTNTQLNDLDSKVTKYLKKWLNIPSHGATSAILYSHDGLKLCFPSQLYKEAHVLAYASSRYKADEKVQSALDAKLSREGEWSRKMSLCNAPVCEDYVNRSRDVNWEKTKQNIKRTLNDEQKLYWREKIAPLVFQGDLLKLVELEQCDLTWRSIIYDLPRGVLSFITRAAINSLPTADNLKRWGKKMNTKCKMCGNHETLLHVLNMCQKALEQERFNFRHDSIVNYLVTVLKSLNQGQFEIYADIHGNTVNGGTVPSDIVPTVQRPDIVLVNRNDKYVIIGELTVPFEPNIDKARIRKVEKYSPLSSDIEEKGYTCKLICFEVGSRGLITKGNKQNISTLLRAPGQPVKVKDHIASISKLSIIASYIIYNARVEPTWTKPSLLTV